MEIYILRDGQEIGPFTEESMHKMLKDGSVAMNDLAWQPGMEGWTPVQSVLFPSADQSEASAAWGSAPPVALQTAPVDPVTPKQRAFLSYMGIPCTEDMSKEQAAVLINDALEEPKNAVRVARWNDDRLRLHPELFAAEIAAKKEARIQHYFDLCQLEGAEAVDGVTKAHCQVLVGYLDVKAPNWDSNPHDALWSFFLPAIAEKFPQLVRSEWKGKLKYAAAKVSPELKRRTAAVRTPVRKQSSPIASLAKGLFYGICIVGVVGGTLYLQNHPAKRDELFEKTGLAKLLKQKSGKAASERSKPSTELATKTPATVANEPATPVSTASQASSPAPAPVTSPEIADQSPKPVATNSTFSPAQPVAPAPEMAAPAPTGPADSSLMAPAPAMPAAEAAPAAAPAPATTSMSLFDPNPTPAAKPAAPGVPAATDAPPVPAPKSIATLTQTIDVPLQFGKVKVPAGTHLKIVQQDGLNLKVQFQNQVISIPVNVTDLVDEAPAAAQ